MILMKTIMSFCALVLSWVWTMDGINRILGGGRKMKGCVVCFECFLLTHGWAMVTFPVQRIIAAPKPNKNCWFLGLTEQCIHSIQWLASECIMVP